MLRTINEIVKDIDALKKDLTKLLNKPETGITIQNYELEEKCNFLNEVVNKANVLIHVNDVIKMTLVWGNSKFKEILGYTAEEITAMGTDYNKTHYHPDDYKLLVEAAEFFKQEKGTTHTLLYRVRHRDGTWMKLITTRSLFKRKPTGEPWLVIAITIKTDADLHTNVSMDETRIKNNRKKNAVLIEKLTKKELQIISYIVTGKSNKAIATELGLSFNTINVHRRNIFLKLKITKTAQLVNFATDNGLN
ncbi:MAG: LuxR C-terminal-related transcriptional regulator [Bacteroidales bacterium]|nr:LuxR C-terminal-related transcriptional regulator [Bacteroidales bacterium]